MNIRLLILLTSFLVTANTKALSPEATEGKTLFQTCNACHNTALDPAKGPPMWGVQRRYKRQYGDFENFVNKVSDFVKAPSEEKAIQKEALKMLGLMPAMPLPDDMLKKIATYIWEENFPAPCDHWQMAIKKAKASGDLTHAKKDQRQLDRFCN